MLPDLSAVNFEEARKTGTDDVRSGEPVLADCLALSERSRGTSVDSERCSTVKSDRMMNDKANPENTRKTANFEKKRSGEGGIRTLGEIAPTPVFETGPIGRSGTSPQFSLRAMHVDED